MKRCVKLKRDCSRHRDRFVLKCQTAVRPRDVQQAIRDEKPQVVHFCGEGQGKQGLVLEDESGKPKLVSIEALADLFRLFAEQVDCVVLNACYSEAQASAIAQHIDAVIGMNRAISGAATIEFAVGFYGGLGAGETIEQAFELGRNAMQLQGIAEEQTPVLIAEVNRRRSRIFVSYEGEAELDEAIALEVSQTLSQTHDVFMRTPAEIQQADFVIALLSPHSVYSERVAGEIQTAHHLSQERGYPKILPVRVAYR